MDSVSQEEISLEAREAKDPGMPPGRAHVSQQFLEDQGWSWGDLLEVRGEERTAVVLSPHRESSEEGVLWLRERVLRNASVDPGTRVTVSPRKSQALEFIHFQIVPGQKDTLPAHSGLFSSWYLDHLSGCPLTLEDRVSIPYPLEGGPETICRIQDLDPSPIGVAYQDTEIEISDPDEETT